MADIKQTSNVGRVRPTRTGMPPSRSGERLHIQGEATSSSRNKASRVPGNTKEGKQSSSNAGRRVLGDVSNLEKNLSTYAHGEDVHHISKTGTHMRATHHDEVAYKHKPTNLAPSGAAAAVRRDTKVRSSASSNTSTGSSNNSTSASTAASSNSIRHVVGAKRVRGSDSVDAAPRSHTTVAPQVLRQTSAQPEASGMELDGYTSDPRSRQNTFGADAELEGLPSKQQQHQREVEEDEDMSADDGDEEEEDEEEDLSDSDDLSDVQDAPQAVDLDDAVSIASGDGSEAADFNPDPECLVTLPPDLQAEACQRVALITDLYEQEVILPQTARAALERQQAVAAGEIAADIAAHDDELALMGLDPEEVRDTSMVAEYAKEIFAYMAKCERETLANPHYISYQNEIQWHMRATLVDWLLQVHMRYHMLPETLWIAVNIVDRFLSVRVVSLRKLQLVGVTAMFIAAKYEEIVAPSVDEFVFMTEGGYSKEEIFKGERIVLSTLDFKVSSYCSPYSWVRKISKADEYDIQTRTLSKFLMEVTLLDYRFLRAKPSLIAAIGMFLSKKMLGGQWDNGFVYYSGFCEEQLIPGANLLLERLVDPAFGEHFVCRKYANRRFLKASIFARDWAKRHHTPSNVTAEVAATAQCQHMPGQQQHGGDHFN